VVSELKLDLVTNWQIQNIMEKLILKDEISVGFLQKLLLLSKLKHVKF